MKVQSLEFIMPKLSNVSNKTSGSVLSAVAFITQSNELSTFPTKPSINFSIQKNKDTSSLLYYSFLILQQQHKILLAK